VNWTARKKLVTARILAGDETAARNRRAQARHVQEYEKPLLDGLNADQRFSYARLRL